MTTKSELSFVMVAPTLDGVGRSYYAFCLEQALTSVRQARALVKGDVTDANHELPRIERLLADALEAC